MGSDVGKWFIFNGPRKISNREDRMVSHLSFYRVNHTLTYYLRYEIKTC